MGTKVGIIRNASGVITQVVTPDNDTALNTWPLKAGETIVQINKTTYNTFVSMKALAANLGLTIT